MELAEQYWNLKGEVRQLVGAIDNEAVYENIDAENAEADKLEREVDRLLKIIIALRECHHKLKEAWK